MMTALPRQEIYNMTDCIGLIVHLQGEFALIVSVAGAHWLHLRESEFLVCKDA